MLSTVDYEIDNQIARIYLNRPERLNAVNPQLVEDFCQALDQSQLDGARVLIIAGRGKAFCAGFDLKEEQTAISEGEQRQSLQRVQDVTRKIRQAPFPVIAAVHGYALGAGCEFALGCDLIYATKNTEFGFPEVSVGLSVTGGISHILPKIIGLVKAKELLFLGKRFGAKEAQNVGLINKTVEPDELENEVIKVAKVLHNLPQLALSRAKIALNHGVQTDIETAYEMEIDHALAVALSLDAKLGAEKFRKNSKNI